MVTHLALHIAEDVLSLAPTAALLSLLQVDLHIIWVGKAPSPALQPYRWPL